MPMLLLGINASTPSLGDCNAFAFGNACAACRGPRLEQTSQHLSAASRIPCKSSKSLRKTCCNCGSFAADKSASTTHHASFSSSTVNCKSRTPLANQVKIFSLAGMIGISAVAFFFFLDSLISNLFFLLFFFSPSNLFLRQHWNLHWISHCSFPRLGCNIGQRSFLDLDGHGCRGCQAGNHVIGQA